MKKICHITSAHPRYDTRIFAKQCSSLAQNGYDVTLLVNDNKDSEIINDVKIESTRNNYKNRFSRIIKGNYLLYKKALQINADIYHVHDPDLLIICNKLKRLGKQVIFDSHEDVPEQIKSKNWIPRVLRKTIAYLYESFEKKSIKNYDAVITVTPHIVERLKNINNNTVMITNYPIIDLDEKFPHAHCRAICFAGGITNQWNHHIILEAMSYVKNIKYILAGSGSEDYIKKLQNHKSWESVDYRGKIPFSEVKKLYLESSIGMALNYSNQARNIGTLGNTKLFEYMEAELPVICTNYELWSQIIDENKCGITVNPHDEKELASAINFMLNNPQESAEMGKRGREAVVKHYNWKTQENILLSLYSTL